MLSNYNSQHIYKKPSVPAGGFFYVLTDLILLADVGFHMLDALYNFAGTFYAMKKHSLIIFSLMATMALTVLASVQAFAQDPVSYFMEGSSFQMQWNPAFAPKKRLR